MVRRGIAIILSFLVLFFTALSVLAIWDVIDVENILSKSLSTLLVVVVSSLVILFIYSVIYKPSDKNNTGNQTNVPPGGDQTQQGGYQ